MRNKTVLLVYPKYEDFHNPISLHAPLGLLYLAASLEKAGYNPVIFDQRIEKMTKFYSYINGRPIAAAAFTVMTGKQIKYAIELAEHCKALMVPTVFGGVHPTILPDQTLYHPAVDNVVIGEGEQALLQVLERDCNGIIAHSPLLDMDELPPVPWHFIDVEKYVHNGSVNGRALPFLFSRGCPHECTFCCNPILSGRTWRHMSVDKATAELDDMVEKYNLDGIFFLDENFTAVPKITMQIARQIRGRYKWYAQTRADYLLRQNIKLLESCGAERFGIGIESGSPRILKQIKKGETIEQFIQVNRRLAETHIETWNTWIMGYPSETQTDIKDTVNLALKMLDENPNARNNNFYMLAPYPGSEIAEDLHDKLPNTFDGWAKFDRHNYHNLWHKSYRLKLYERIGFSSKFVGRRLQHLPGVPELAEIFTRKWREFDFTDDKEWERLIEQGTVVLENSFKNVA